LLIQLNINNIKAIFMSMLPKQ